MSAYMNAKPYHVAHVVPDLDKAVDRLIAAGIGPAHFIRSIDMRARYRGKIVDIRVSAAFVVIAGTLTELVMQEAGAPSSFTDFIARHPSGALHHIAYHSGDFAKTIAAASEKGRKLIPHMEYIDQEGNDFESYFEPEGNPDAVLIQLALPSPLDPVYDHIREIADAWDGSEPRRNFWSLVPAEFVA